MLLELPGVHLSDGSVADTVDFQFPKHVENAIKFFGWCKKLCACVLGFNNWSTFLKPISQIKSDQSQDTTIITPKSIAELNLNLFHLQLFG